MGRKGRDLGFRLNPAEAGSKTNPTIFLGTTLQLQSFPSTRALTIMELFLLLREL